MSQRGTRRRSGARSSHGRSARASTSVTIKRPMSFISRNDNAGSRKAQISRALAPGVALRMNVLAEFTRLIGGGPDELASRKLRSADGWKRFTGSPCHEDQAKDIEKHRRQA